MDSFLCGHTEAEPVGHAVIVQGADLASEKLLGPLHIIQTVSRLSRLHFAALLGMAAAEGEWMASSREEAQEVVHDSPAAGWKRKLFSLPARI